MISSFVKKSYKTPINCHHCAEFLWGFSCTGYSCEGIIIITIIIAIIITIIITITGVIITAIAKIILILILLIRICEKPSTVLL